MPKEQAILPILTCLLLFFYPQLCPGSTGVAKGQLLHRADSMIYFFSTSGSSTVKKTV